MYKHNERNGRTFKKGKIRREGGVIEDPIKDANRTKKKKKSLPIFSLPVAILNNMLTFSAATFLLH